MRSVLVIEDDPAMAQAIADVFTDAGYHPVSVRTLAEGRTSLVEDRPELVVLDLTLETEFGAGLLEDLSSRAESPPVVIVSGFGLAPMVAQRFSVPLVNKPFGVDALLAAAERAIDQSLRPRRVGA